MPHERERVMSNYIALVLAIAFLAPTPIFASGSQIASNDAGVWNSHSAAAYLDKRLSWWTTWKNAERDHGTFCISSHTGRPDALGRPALRAALNEHGPSASEGRVLENVTKRVSLWSAVLAACTEAEKDGATTGGT